jgi:hypothetical protein
MVFVANGVVFAVRDIGIGAVGSLVVIAVGGNLFIPFATSIGLDIFGLI